MPFPTPVSALHVPVLCGCIGMWAIRPLEPQLPVNCPNRPTACVLQTTCWTSCCWGATMRLRALWPRAAWSRGHLCQRPWPMTWTCCRWGSWGWDGWGRCGGRGGGGVQGKGLAGYMPSRLGSREMCLAAQPPSFQAAPGYELR